jgi:hypothetical protein
VKKKKKKKKKEKEKNEKKEKKKVGQYQSAVSDHRKLIHNFDSDHSGHDHFLK